MKFSLESLKKLLSWRNLRFCFGSPLACMCSLRRLMYFSNQSRASLRISTYWQYWSQLFSLYPHMFHLPHWALQEYKLRFMAYNVIGFVILVENGQTPGDELKWVRNAAEEDTVALGSQRGMVVCISCNDDKVWSILLVSSDVLAWIVTLWDGLSVSCAAPRWFVSPLYFHNKWGSQQHWHG